MSRRKVRAKAKPIMSFYILDEKGHPQQCADVIKWAHWFGIADRTVRRENIGDISVSTVFLGVDHNFSGEGPPILWETMVFGEVLDGEQRRYCSEAEARLGHDEITKRVLAATADNKARRDGI